MPTVESLITFRQEIDIADTNTIGDIKEQYNQDLSNGPDELG